MILGMGVDGQRLAQEVLFGNGGDRSNTSLWSERGYRCGSRGRLGLPSGFLPAVESLGRPAAQFVHVMWRVEQARFRRHAVARNWIIVRFDP